MRRVTDYLAYLVVRLLVCVVQAMSIEACAAVARFLATICCDRPGFRYRVIDDNLRHAFPEMSSKQRRDVNWRMWEHLFLMAVEVIQAPRKVLDTNWRQYAEVVNEDHLIRSFFEKRP